MTSGWVFSEIVRGVTGERIDKFVHKEFIRRLGCSNELFFPIPETYLGTVKTTAETKVQTAPPAGSATSCSPPTVNDKTHFHFNNRKSVSPSPLPSFRQERYVLDDIASRTLRRVICCFTNDCTSGFNHNVPTSTLLSFRFHSSFSVVDSTLRKSGEQ